MSSIARIEGPNLVLRLIEPDDAAYVHCLRSNPKYNEHLSEVTGSIADQNAWIRAYKVRESAGEELYYVIERRDSTRCGLVRLYEIGPDQFTWGSWILDANKPGKAALESAVLSFGVGFDYLGATFAKVDVRVENEHAAAFYKRLGMVETHRNKQDIFFRYTAKQYADNRDRYFKLVKDG